jgi:2-haloacid dehalogenase
MDVTDLGVRALVCDVFGTVVDWRGSVAEAGRALGQRRGIEADWERVADAWRGQYQPAMERVRSGERGWTSLDVLHRESLEGVLADLDIRGLSDADKDELTLAWHRLRPWPDAVLGLSRLRARFITATLSNGNVLLLTELAKHGGLPFDTILSAELAHAYKPDPRTYGLAAEVFGPEPGRVLMVAAHQDDLRAAARCGLRTAFIPRPLEWGPQAQPDLTPDPLFDIVAADFVALAERLGC